jgi:hypothetical protein
VSSGSTASDGSADRRAQGASQYFDEEFVDKEVPEWGDLIARVLERG